MSSTCSSTSLTAATTVGGQLGSTQNRGNSTASKPVPELILPLPYEADKKTHAWCVHSLSCRQEGSQFTWCFKPVLKSLITPCWCLSALSGFSRVPKAVHCLPITFKSKFHAGEWEKYHYHYTSVLVTCRSPKGCRDRHISRRCRPGATAAERAKNNRPGHFVLPLQAKAHPTESCS